MDTTEGLKNPDFGLIFGSYDAELADNDESDVLLSTKLCSQFTTVIREFCHSISWDASTAHSLPPVLDTFASWVVDCVQEGSSPDLIQFISSSVLSYDDVKFVLLKQAEAWLSKEDWNSKEYRNVNCSRCFTLLSSIPSPLSKARSFCLNMNTLTQYFEIVFYLPEEVYRKVSETLVQQLRFKKMQSLYSNVWVQFCKLKHPLPCLRLILNHIPEDVMPNLQDPTLLTDFLARAFQLPVPYNILALNGLFLLIVHHNLEYPNFYSTVYSLLTPAVLHCNERNECFKLLDQLMSSTHLPAYVLAAFVKRLSRLCLLAPLDTLSPILALIHNWVVRHPSLQTLVHKDNPENICEDPFLEDESDPAACRAMLSSLWELKTLNCHFHHSVVRGSGWASNAIPPIEKPVTWKSAKDLWGKDMKKPMVNMTNPNVPTNFLPPGPLFSSKYFEFADYFDI